MSIDLAVNTSQRLSLGDLRETARKWGKTLTGFEPPTLTIDELLLGRKVPCSQEVAETHGKSYVLLWTDSEDGVTLIVSDGEPPSRTTLTFSVGASRAATEYVLALAASLAAGELVEADVLDHALFWSEKEIVSGLALLPLFAAGGSFEEACHLAAHARGA